MIFDLFLHYQVFLFLGKIIIEVVSLSSLIFNSFSSRYSFDAAINSPARNFGYTINTVALFTTYGLFLYKLFGRGLHGNLLSLSFR